MIKAYRVRSTDRLTLVCEVLSQPPAVFMWSCNDMEVTVTEGKEGFSLGATKFFVRHGLNVSTLTIDCPQQGVYSCSAKNPAGISRSYGYITIDDSRNYQSVGADETIGGSRRPQVSGQFIESSGNQCLTFR